MDTVSYQLQVVVPQLSVQAPALLQAGSEAEAAVAAVPAGAWEKVVYQFGEQFYAFQEVEYSATDRTVEDETASGGKARRGVEYDTMIKTELPEGIPELYIWYRGRGADFCLKTYTNQEKQWQWVKGSTQYTWRKYGPYSSAELQNGLLSWLGL